MFVDADASVGPSVRRFVEVCKAPPRCLTLIFS